MIYAGNTIDAAGKALLPLFDEMIAKGDSVFAPTFPARYVKAMRNKMGDALMLPSAFTKEMALFATHAFDGALANEVVRITRTGSMWSHLGPCCDERKRLTFANERDKTRLIILTPDEVAQATFLPSALQTKLKAAPEASKPSVALAVDFPPDESAVIVVLARDPADITRAREGLMKQPTLSARVWMVQ
jgi:hypothetical protein